MAGSETLYTARLQGPEILELGRANTITCPVYRDGAIVAPSVGVLTAWNANNTKILDAVSATITGQVATYAVLSASLVSADIADGWRFEWALTLSGSVYTFPRYGSLVYRRLYPVITDADLLRAHPDFTRRKPPTEGSYQDYLDEAWLQIESRLINTGKRPWLIMDPSALRMVHLYCTLALVFRDFATGGSASAEWEMMLRYEALYQSEWDRLTFPVREPTTGQDIDPGKRKSGTPTLWLCKPARRTGTASGGVW